MWVYCGKGSGCGKSMISVSVALLPCCEISGCVDNDLCRNSESGLNIKLSDD